MGLFDRTATYLAKGPTLLFTADPVDPLTDLLKLYDPSVRVRGDRLVFANGVLLYGPIDITQELAVQARLPAGMAVAYHAGVAIQSHRERRPDEAKWRDAHLLVRGLAKRLDGTVHGERPPMDVDLRASVYSGQVLPVEQVTGVLQPYLDDELKVEKDQDSYFLVTDQDPPFVTVYWPPRLSRWKEQPPPPALGPLREREPCRWELRSKFTAATADRDVCLKIGEAALALAKRADGVAIDMYGFPFARPADLLPSGL